MPGPIIRSLTMGLVYAASMGMGAKADESTARAELTRAELTKDGTIRIALVEAPTAGVFFVGRGADGVPRGVTAQLGADLAASLGATPSFVVFPNSGEATDAVRTKAVELAFMPVDDARRAVLAFGPGYYALESTYLVTAASRITDVKEVDREGLRVIGIANTTTIRASARTLAKTQPVAVPSVAESIAMMKDGRADAFALSRDSLPAVARQVPGSRIVTGGFQQTLVAVAVPRERPAALAFATQWLSAAKRNGTVRRIFDANGLGEEAVAP